MQTKNPNQNNALPEQQNELAHPTAATQSVTLEKESEAAVRVQRLVQLSPDMSFRITQDENKVRRYHIEGELTDEIFAEFGKIAGRYKEDCQKRMETKYLPIVTHKLNYSVKNFGKLLFEYLGGTGRFATLKNDSLSVG